jgi:trimeric autotransporter adhesin
MRKLLLLPALAGVVFLVACSSNSNSGSSNSGNGNGGGNGQAVLQTITVSPSTATIAQGTTQAFTATGNFSDGSQQNLTATVQWSCLLPNVAAVSSNSPTQGEAMGVSPGMALITASSGSVSNSAQLTVSAATLTSLAVTPATATIEFGNQQQFTATATFSDQSTQDVTNLASWQASSPFITANAGLAIGESVGSDNITATFTQGQSGNNQSGSATLTVNLSNLVSVSIVPANPSVANHTRIAFSAIGTFNDGSTRDVTNVATWSSSSSIATGLNNTPNIFDTAGVGATTISASVGTLNPSTTLNVTSATLQSIVVFPASASIAPTTELDYTGVGVFSDSSTQDLSSLKWSTADSTIASVKALTGEVTGLTAGFTTIGVTSSTQTGSVQGSTPITVTTATLSPTAPITLTPATAFLPPGGTLSYSAIGSFSDGSTQDITGSAHWTSSEKSVATLSANVATAQGLGESTITATLGSFSGTGSLSVVAPQQISIAVTPATVQMASGTTALLTTTGTFNGGTQNATTLVIWTSSAPNIATVDYQTGLVSALAPGQSTITATLGSTTSTAQLTVTNASLTSITISPVPSMPLGSSQQFTASGNFSDGTNQSLPTVNWSSSNTAIVAIDNAGVANATGAGSATITATLDGVSGTTNVTVP